MVVMSPDATEGRGEPELLAGSSLAEVHQLPDGGVGGVLHDRARAPVLDGQFAGETQIGAVEADERGGQLLEAVQLVDQFVHRKVPVAGEGDDVAVVAV